MEGVKLFHVIPKSHARETVLVLTTQVRQSIKWNEIIFNAKLNGVITPHLWTTDYNTGAQELGSQGETCRMCDCSVLVAINQRHAAINAVSHAYSRQYTP